MSTDGESNFARSLRALLASGNTVNALDLFGDNKFSEEVKDNAWDLVPVIAEHLTEQSEKNNVEVFKCCEKLLEIVVENSKPEDVLLQFIEEIESASDDTKFVMLLRPLRKVLLRVPDKRLLSLEWCFNAMLKYVHQLKPTYEFSNCTDEDKLLLDSDDNIIRIINLYRELLDFAKFLVDELTTVQKNLEERTNVVCKFLIQLMGIPMAHLPVDVYKTTKSSSRRIAEALVEQVCKIRFDPFVYLEMIDGKDSSELVKPDDLSLGVFYHFLLTEELFLKSTPKVYNPVFVLQHSLKFIIMLLTQENQFSTEKGIQLTLELLKSINVGSLDYLLLDLEDHCKFSNALCYNLIFNEVKVIRMDCLEIFKKYLWAFDHVGRYLLIKNLMKTRTESNLRGFIITQFKEMLRCELSSGSLPKSYCGTKLFDLIDHFAHLKEREKTDLVDASEEIISMLNLLRFICIADKNGDTLIDYYWDNIEDNFIADLRLGINMARPHYKLKVKEINGETEKKPENEGENKDDIEMSVEVSGKPLETIPSSEKIKILNMSLTTLDMIDSLMNRFIECLSIRRSSAAAVSPSLGLWEPLNTTLNTLNTS